MKALRRHGRLLLLLATAALFGSSGWADAEGGATELGWTTRLVGEGHELRRDSPFAAGLPLTGFGRDRYRIEQELRGRAGPVSLLLTATESGQEGAKPNGRFLANEAYVDFSLGGQRVSAGKKVLAGDVGYAFRPIDVLQRESRMQMMPPQLEGIPMLSWDNFTTDGAWSLVIANPGHQKRGEARDDGSVALKLYRRIASADFHGVLRNSTRYGLEAGAATSWVPDEALELHASLLVQTRGERRLPTGRHRAGRGAAGGGWRHPYGDRQLAAQGAGRRHLDHGGGLLADGRSLVGRQRAGRRGLAAPGTTGRAASRPCWACPASRPPPWRVRPPRRHASSTRATWRGAACWRAWPGANPAAAGRCRPTCCARWTTAARR
jgi:hypothetical protein